MQKNTKILIAGDLFPMPCNYSLFESGDIKTLFGDRLCRLFEQADFCICNLEGVFTDNDTPIEKAGPAIKAPVSTVKAVKKLGIDFATLGNTHSMDFGRQGFLDTCKTLDNAGIIHFGWGSDAEHIRTHAKISHSGRTVILYNVTEQFENAPEKNSPGVNLYDEYRVCNELKELKKECNVLIVFYHGGIEGTHFNSGIIRKRFHRMADCGADVIISQHTHAIGEQENYNSTYLLYGQGNFCFHFRKDVTDLLAEGLVLELDITDKGITPKPHRIIRTEYGCMYDNEQNLASFYERSRLHDMLLNGSESAIETFKNGFAEDCGKWAGTLMWAMRGNNNSDSTKMKELSAEEFKKYFSSCYTKQQLMVMQMFLRNEEFNEIGRCIIENILKDMDRR